METPGPSTDRPSRKRGFRDSSLAQSASRFIEIFPDGKASCRFDSECHYVQQRLDVNNFIRHFRTQHPAKAVDEGFLSEEPPAKKQRLIPKRSIAIDRQLLLEVLIKLVAYHNVPISFVEWDAMVQLLDPLKAALGVTVDRRLMYKALDESAKRIKDEISKEMKGLLVSLKIDSASRHYRHVLALLAQYALDGTIVTRTLGKFYKSSLPTFEFQIEYLSEYEKKILE